MSQGGELLSLSNRVRFFEFHTVMPVEGHFKSFCHIRKLKERAS
jgi:hypothetical protein